MANLTPRLPIGRALDLGTGCGLQALLIALHAEQVIATDLNPRAAEAAELNARRNGFNNVEVRQGDLYEPVTGNRFDLIVANPPYVVSPDTRFLYRDAGGRGGGICSRIVRGLPQHLRLGGCAIVQAQWPLRRGEAWWAAPKQWTDGAGLDLWLIGHGWASPEAYARAWLAEGTGKAVAARGDVQRWLSWYAQRAIRALMTGVLILRRRSGGTWRRALQAPRKPSGDCSAQILRIFRTQEQLNRMSSNETMLRGAFKLAQGCRMVNPSGGEGLSLRAEPDIGWSGAIAQQTVPLVLGLDGRRTLAEIVAASEGLHSRERVSTATLANIRQLFGAGFLELGSYQ